MEKEKVEQLILIAERNPPGDNWILESDKTKTIHPSITDALEAWFEKTGEKVEFRLAPLDGKLYAIVTEEQEIKPPPVKMYNIYGDPEN